MNTRLYFKLPYEPASESEVVGRISAALSDHASNPEELEAQKVRSSGLIRLVSAESRPSLSTHVREVYLTLSGQKGHIRGSETDHLMLEIPWSPSMIPKLTSTQELGYTSF